MATASICIFMFAVYITIADSCCNSNSCMCPLPSSCQDIKKRMPDSQSGVYLLATSEKKTQYVYCHMEPLCGSNGGWTRIANFDMSDPEENCPVGFMLFNVNNIRACGRPASGGGSCRSVKFPSNGITYSQVCGRVRGYQHTSPDAVDPTLRGAGVNDINSFYVDGISLTRGNPREHIWTFMAGAKEDNSIAKGTYTCPCQTGSMQSGKIPPFIKNDYYCESGNPIKPGGYAFKLYTDDPLWDGDQCRDLEEPCCRSCLLPWFHKALGTTTSDFIEARVCCDQSTGDENVAVEQIEIYVK